MLFSIIIVSLFISVENLHSKSNVKKDEIKINNKNISITISNFRNSNYLMHTEFAKILDLSLEIKGGKLTFNSPKFSVTFLRGSSFVVIKAKNKEHIKQLHLPVVEISDIYYLPYPTSLTLLDSAGVLNVQIDKQQQIAKYQPPSYPQLEVVADDTEIADNVEQIRQTYLSVKERQIEDKPIPKEIKKEIPKNLNLNTKQNNPKTKDNKVDSKKNKTEITTKILSEDKPLEQITEKKEIENKSEEKVYHIDPLKTEPIKKETINVDQTPMVTPETKQNLNGYKIPKDLKRKRLEKLLGQNGI